MLLKPPLNIKVSRFFTFIEKQNVVNAEHSRNHSAVVYSIPAPSWLFEIKVLGVLCSTFAAFKVFFGTLKPTGINNSGSVTAGFPVKTYLGSLMHGGGLFKQ